MLRSTSLSLAALALVACSASASKAPAPQHAKQIPSASAAPKAPQAPPSPPLGPQPIPARGRALKVRVDQGHACAVLASGEVACWGENQVGELGLSYRMASSIPLLVPEVSGATQVFPLGGLSCALRGEQPIVCWGMGYGPQAIPGTEGARDMAEGREGLCVVLRSGRISCFNPSNLDAPSIGIDGVTDAIAITPLAWGRACAVLADGGVSCWGDLGEIAQGPDPSPPKRLAQITDAVAAVHLEQHLTCFQRRSNAVKCVWDPDMPPPVVPARASQLAERGPRFIQCYRDGGEVRCRDGGEESKLPLGGAAVDLGCSQTACCVVLEDGSVHCLGNNEVGLLGDGAPLNLSAPKLVEGVPPASRLALGSDVSFALTQEGKVLGWGWTTSRPTEVWFSDRAVDVDAASIFGLVRTAGGELWEVAPEDGKRAFDKEKLPKPGGEVVDSSLDDNRTVCVARKAGTVACLFHEGEGGGYEEAFKPIAGTGGVVSISAIGGSTCGLRADGKVVCIIDHRFDEDDDFPNGAPPARGELVPGLSGVKWLATPYAGLSNGDVVMIRKEENRYRTEPEPRLKGATLFADGGFDWSPGCIVKDGKLHAWAGHLEPKPLAPELSPTFIAAGNDHACMLDEAGAIYCWGRDDRGQLGQGRLIRSTTPVRVVGLGP